MLGGKSTRTTLQLAAVFSIGSLVLFAGAFRLATSHPRGSEPFGNSAPSPVRAGFGLRAADLSPVDGNRLADVEKGADPTTNAASTDDVAASADSTEDDALKDVRKAAYDYVRAAYPNSKIDGMFTLSFAKGNLYLAGADGILDTGQPRRTLNLLVRLYTRRNGSQYFRAESISDSAAAAFLKKTPSDDSRIPE